MIYNSDSVMHENSRRTTRRELFLQTMDEVIPWDEWVDYIFTQCPDEWLGHSSSGMEKMLRLYLLQTWFSLNEETILDNISDSHAMRAFVGGSIGGLPGAHELASFRRLLNREGISDRLSDSINRALRKGGAVLRPGSIVDAAIIRTPRGGNESNGQNRQSKPNQVKTTIF